MARTENNRSSAGILGNSQSVSTNICSIPNIGVGRYEIRGSVRHTLEDGCKLVVGAALVLFRIPQTATQTVPFGPIIMDVLLPTDGIILQLAVATGASDTAAGVIYAQKLNQ
jgi:hypothetical protein